MYRSHHCGELRMEHVGQTVTLSGWVQRSRDMGGLTFLDLRDRYGLTQLSFNLSVNEKLCMEARKLGREFVIQATGLVKERSSKNAKMPTGDIEIEVTALKILNASQTPPFTIEENTDGGEELRMKFRYLDLRRETVRKKLELRHTLARYTRQYLDEQAFIEVETPVLIKSTPEGARDFIVPSRLNQGEFYALPQSPQTFKQLLMVSGFDRYYQIVKCFRDEDLRADRQPEFTQIDCEMSFVERDDVLNTFEGLTKYLFKKIKGIDLPDFPRMSYDEAMARYGIDKPDTRFAMEICQLNNLIAGTDFAVFKSVIDENGLIGGICAAGCAEYSRKQLDELTEWVKDSKRGMKGLVYVKWNKEGIKSSVDKFFSPEQLKSWIEAAGGKEGDLLLVLAGPLEKTQKALGELRLELAKQLGLRDTPGYNPLWVIDFPLVEYNAEEGRYYAMHHPFTSPNPEDLPLMDTDPAAIRANAYDLVINGVEIGGGSIRIHDRGVQQKMFDLLGFTREEAQEQFGFLMNAFEYGAPPHGGIAFGFDRLCAMFGGVESIRDFIAFPKNNAGRDVMIDAPGAVNPAQLKELGLKITE
ncbi:MAG TPA: aspartate--tRNA ligase [Bacteroidetes bacterium]|nr:aspartate--tRNA ligase [Bacteroidota bacterium]